jgi:BASS family bile acid:Na+ symporter
MGKPMVGQFEQIALALMVFIIMLGMGATIRMSNFKNALAQPKGFAVGMLCQFGLMPAIALLLAIIFQLPPAIALSLILVGATPGGTTSNLFAYYAKGDVALSVTMTVASTIAAVVLMPLAIAIYASGYTSAELQIPFSNIVATLILVLVPVAIGMFILSRSERVAKFFEKAASYVGAILIIGLIAKFVLQNIELLIATKASVYLAAILLGLVGFLLGYVISRAVGLNEATSRTVSLETGIQNTPLTIAVIILSFAAGAQQDEMLLLPTFYAVFIVISSTLVSIWFRNKNA